MTVKLKLVGNFIECFEADSFRLAPLKLMRPDILKAEVYANGKRLAKVSRPFKKFYEKFIYKPEPKNEEPSVAEQVTEEPQE